MHSFAGLLAFVILHISGIHAFVFGPPPEISEEDKAVVKVSTFEQFIDHNNHDLGTFSQRYFYNDQYWKGEGSPVVLYNNGESNGSGSSTSNLMLPGRFAQEIQGAAIELEHRYWGESSPYDLNNLTTENLQYLTFNQSIADMVNFAKNVKLPFDKNGSSNADKAPWALTGASYSGALAAWTASVHPGVFWAYHASSAPVQIIEDYWQYYEPIREGLPKNCTTDVNRVIDYFDNVFRSNDTRKQQDLKTKFGGTNFQHLDDFADMLSTGVGSFQYSDGRRSAFEFCDFIENSYGKNGSLPGPGGVGLRKALDAFGMYTKKAIASEGYQNSHNANGYDKHSGVDASYQWIWMTCNEFGWWPRNAPKNASVLNSRLVTTAKDQRECGFSFPEQNGHTHGLKNNSRKKIADLNAWTKGWMLTNTTRLMWTNGENDPWRSASVSSKFRPGGPLPSTPSAPVYLVPKGIHAQDYIIPARGSNPPLEAIINSEIAQMKEWVDEYYHR